MASSRSGASRPAECRHIAVSRGPTWQGAGWFESTWELTRGLEVREAALPDLEASFGGFDFAEAAEAAGAVRPEPLGRLRTGGLELA